MDDVQVQGTIFNIQSYSVHDGPGIRTIVFFKGCPLRCRWCGNPESQHPGLEKGWNSELCQGCGACVAKCPQKALTLQASGLNRHAGCSDCGACLDVCPAGAIMEYGRKKSVGEILDDVERDDAFYSRSGGGITLSGGEPLFQPVFALALLREARRRHIHRAMESCGVCAEDIFLQAASLLDYLLLDIKTLDSAKHREWTGASNEVALSNLAAARREFPSLRIHIRTPVIPGVNDTSEEIAAIASFAKRQGANTYEILQYHRMGAPKYKNLGRPYPMGDASLEDERFAKLQEVAVEAFTAH